MLKTARFFDLLRIPGFKPLAAATLMLGVAMSFTAPYLSLFGVERAGMTPLKLGLFMTLIAAIGVAVSGWAGKWSDRHGHHRTLLLAAIGAAALVGMTPTAASARASALSTSSMRCRRALSSTMPRIAALE